MVLHVIPRGGLRLISIYIPCPSSGVQLSVSSLFVAMKSHCETTGREWRGQIDMDGALDQGTCLDQDYIACHFDDNVTIVLVGALIAIFTTPPRTTLTHPKNIFKINHSKKA